MKTLPLIRMLWTWAALLGMGASLPAQAVTANSSLADAQSILLDLLFADTQVPSMRKMESGLLSTQTLENDQVRARLKLAALSIPNQLPLAQRYLNVTSVFTKKSKAEDKVILDELTALLSIPKERWLASLNPSAMRQQSRKRWSLPDFQSSSLQARLQEASIAGQYMEVVQVFKKLRGLPRGSYPIHHTSTQAYVNALEGLQLINERNEFLENFSAQRINTPEGVWAFKKLFSACPDAPNSSYKPSVKYLKKLYRQSADAGIRTFIEELARKPFIEFQKKVDHEEFSALVDFLFTVGSYQTLQSHAEEKWNERGSDWVAGDLEKVGRAFWRSGNKYQAAKYLSLAASQETNQKQRRRYQKWLGDLLVEMRLHKHADKVFEEVLKSRNSSLVRWAKFWNQYMAGDFEQSQEELRMSHKIGRRDRYYKEYVLYWKARIAEKLGKNSWAYRLSTLLRKRYPDSYYALMAEFRWGVANMSLEQAVMPEAGVAVDDEPEVAESSISPSSDTEELWFAEFGSQQAVAPLDYTELQNHVFADVAMPSESEYYLFEVAKKAAKAVGLPDGLVKAIMRAESGFRIDAVSPVGARGLMQIMPRTGALIARNLDDTDFTSASLYQPSKNIVYGSYYLKFLLDYYRGNLPLSIAAYNAGPVAVDRWLSRCRDCEIDEFIEWIPYRETRRYVKDVMRYHSLESSRVGPKGSPAYGLEMPTDLPPFREVF